MFSDGRAFILETNNKKITKIIPNCLESKPYTDTQPS